MKSIAWAEVCRRKLYSQKILIFNHFYIFYEIITFNTFDFCTNYCYLPLHFQYLHVKWFYNFILIFVCMYSSSEIIQNLFATRKTGSAMDLREFVSWIKAATVRIYVHNQHHWCYLKAKQCSLMTHHLRSYN